MVTPPPHISYKGLNQNIPLPIKPNAPWLAPLAGFTDLPFRLLCKEQGAAVTCTEMVSAKGLIYGLKAKGEKAQKAALSGTFALLATCAEDTPLVVQLFGEDPFFLGEAVAYLREQGFRYFDLNMGCSVPKVTKTKAGAAMLTDIPNALAAARAMIERAEKGCVGFKLRLGWKEPVFLELAKELEILGASWVTLHPRFATQKFSGMADVTALQKLAQHIKIPVIASGDLFTAEDALNCIKKTGVHGVMFARGALANPLIFKQFTTLQQTGALPLLSHAELAQIIARHAELAKKYSLGILSKRGFSPDILKMRTVVPRYVRHLPKAKQLRLQLSSCTSWQEFDRIMHLFFTS